MRRPTFLLMLLAAGHLAIGRLTFAYPPSYLSVPGLWGAMAVATGLLAGWAMFASRKMVALAGAAVAAQAFARAAAIGAELAWRGVDGAQRASFTIAAITWVLFGAVSLALWRRMMMWGVFDAGPG